MKVQRLSFVQLLILLTLVLLAGMVLGSRDKLAEALEGSIYHEGARAGRAYIDPEFNRSMVDLAEMAIPTVVSISTEQNFNLGRRGGEIPMDNFFDYFFRMPQGQEFKRKGVGSGFIINAEGYIITNNHVVEDADDITVELSEHQSFPAKIIGRDARTDIALIKVDSPRPLPYLKLGDSDALRIGEIVVAVGNPLGLSHTVTQGIVSQKGRKDINPSGHNIYSNFIQTDASINPGNSGGPLLNIYGEVIGINAAIAQATGIGFAIPINMAKTLLPQLMEGKIRRSWMGVQVQKISEELADSLGLPNATGALVSSVVPGSPAEKAGLQPEDVILTFDGRNIENWNDITWYASTAGAGKKVAMEVWRDRKKIDISLKLEEMPGEEQVAAGEDPEGLGAKSDLLGLSVDNPSPRQFKRGGITDNAGAIIVNIDRNSSAAAAGLRPGDIIRKLNRTLIKDRDNFKKAASALKKGDMVRLLINREGDALFLAFRI